MNFYIKVFAIFAIILKVSAIYDGEIAKKNQFPYTVLIKAGLYDCTGTIISAKHILTAAHCLKFVQYGDDLTIIVGTNEYYEYSLSNGMTLESKKFWRHENFSMLSGVNDIGIIELNISLTFSDEIKKLELSEKENAELDDEDKKVVTAGWGRTSMFSEMSDKLRYTNMTLYPLDECKKFKSHYIEDLNENNICAKKIKGMPCNGDSGSAMVSLKTNKIVGILSYLKDAENGVSLGYNDCTADVPIVATRISSYIDWIREKIETSLSNQEEVNVI